MLRKCDRFGFGYPTPGTIASRPDSSSLPGCADRRVQADLAADLDQPHLGQPDRLAVLGVPLILERDDGIDAIVAAVQLQDDQDPAVFLGAGGVAVVRQEAGQRGRAQSASNSADCCQGSFVV